MSDEIVINLAKERAKRNPPRLVHSSESRFVATTRDEIINDALSEMLIELEKKGVDTGQPKWHLRLSVIRRILEETLSELDGQPMTDYMKTILTTL